jgi:hypothetical protein
MKESLSYASEMKVVGDLANALAFDEMTPTNLADGFHVNHSRLLRPKPEGLTHRGGPFWTLFSPKTWILLHAD